MQRGFALLPLVLVLLVAITVYLLVTNFRPLTKLPNNTQSTPESISTESWKTYKNEYAEFKYPSDWKVLDKLPEEFFVQGGGMDEYYGKWNGGKMFLGDCSKNFILHNPKQPSTLVLPRNTCSLTSRGGDMEVYERKLNRDDSTKITILKWTPGGFDIYTGEKFPWKGDLVEEYHFMYSANPIHDLVSIPSYSFMLIHKDGRDNSAEPIFDAILASFKYLKLEEMTLPSKWKIFKSEHLGFSFEYPVEGSSLYESLGEQGPDECYGCDLSAEEWEKLRQLSALEIYRLLYSYLTKEGTFTGILGEGYPREINGIYPESNYTFYSGYPNKSVGVTSMVGFDIAGCEKPTDRPLGKAYIRFNLPGKKIPGVQLSLSLPSDQAKLNTKDCDLNKEELAKDKAVRIKALVDENPKLDIKSKINLKIFQHILETAKIY